MAKKIALGVFALALLIGAGLLVFQAQIGAWAFKRGVESRVGIDRVAALEDGLHLGLCGTGSPMPNPDRAGACNVVIAGEDIYIVDIGEGGAPNLTRMGVNTSQIDSLLLTHFHSDHIDGLGPLMLMHWVREGNPDPLSVRGPVGLQAVIDGFTAAYATDNTYRTAHHGETVAPTSGGGAIANEFEMAADSVMVLKKGDLTITAFKVDHEPIEPAVGYRFDYKGRSVCISGDTKKSANLERACKGVDILVHDALQSVMVRQMSEAAAANGNAIAAKIFGDILDYHASPEQAAQSAKTAGVRMLVLSHLVPPLPSSYIHPAFLANAPDQFDGPIVIGEDGMMFSLPAQGEAIEQANWLN